MVPTVARYWGTEEASGFLYGAAANGHSRSRRMDPRSASYLFAIASILHATFSSDGRNRSMPSLALWMAQWRTGVTGASSEFFRRTFAAAVVKSTTEWPRFGVIGVGKPGDACSPTGRCNRAPNEGHVRDPSGPMQAKASPKASTIYLDCSGVDFTGRNFWISRPGWSCRKDNGRASGRSPKVWLRGYFFFLPASA
jgi:hypothetical protein